jgi:hypothetical protein
VDVDVGGDGEATDRAIGRDAVSRGRRGKRDGTTDGDDFVSFPWRRDGARDDDDDDDDNGDDERDARARGARGSVAGEVGRDGDVEGDERAVREGTGSRRGAGRRDGASGGAKAERERIRGGDDVQGWWRERVRARGGIVVRA